MNDIKVIKTKQDYREALKYVEALMTTDPDRNQQKEKNSLF